MHIVKHSFKVVGIVAQPQGGSPPNVYIPLARAQALGTAAGKSLKHDVNTIYVTAASAAVIPAVQAEIPGFGILRRRVFGLDLQLHADDR